MVQHRHCTICSKPLSTKGHHQIKLQTVFGNLQIRSPRLRCCPCSEGNRTKSFSPLAQVLTERSTPERLYVETLFASLLRELALPPDVLVAGREVHPRRGCQR